MRKYMMGRCKTQSQTLSGIRWKDERQEAQIGKKYIQFKHNFHVFVFKLSVNKQFTPGTGCPESAALEIFKTWRDIVLRNLIDLALSRGPF